MVYYTVWMASTYHYLWMPHNGGKPLTNKANLRWDNNWGYKWDSMYADVRKFVMKNQICEISVGKVRKLKIQNHIKSVMPLQRFQINLAQLSNIGTTKKLQILILHGWSLFIIWLGKVNYRYYWYFSGFLFWFYCFSSKNLNILLNFLK